jgi:hypothetical protein
MLVSQAILSLCLAGPAPASEALQPEPIAAPTLALSPERRAEHGDAPELPAVTLPLTQERLFDRDDDLRSILRASGDRGLADLGPGVRLSFGRPTTLRDGGIDGDRAQLDDSDDRLWSFANASGEFDLYDMSLEWEAWKPGALAVSLIGGVRAIQADVGRVRESRGADGSLSTTLDQARGVVAVPVFGAGIRYDASDALSFNARASTHAGGDGEAFVGFTAETSLRLSPNIGLHAGYQSIRSVLEVRSVDAELSEEGVFARLTIEF